MRDLRSHSQHLRWSRVYLGAIGLVTLLIIVFCIISLEQQRRTIQSISVTGMRLNGERLAVELERSIWQLGESCLRDLEVRNLGLRLSVAGGAAEINQARQELLQRSRVHPIAAHFYIFVGGRLRFPPMSRAVPVRLSDLVLRPATSPAQRQFAKLIREAEASASGDDVYKAIELYRQGYALEVPDSMKAMVLEQIASCSAKVQRPTDAIRAFHQLKREYGDCYDGLGRPYGLVAPLQIDILAQKSAHNATDILKEAYQELVRGKWQVSAPATIALQSQYESRLGSEIGKLDQTPYLRHFVLARVLEKELRSGLGRRSMKIEPLEIPMEPQDTQAFLTTISTGSGPEVILAFSVNLDWVSHVLLPHCGDVLSLDKREAASFQLSPNSRRASDPYPGGSELQVPFRSTFPFLSLRLPPGATAAARAAARTEAYIVGGALVSMCALLGLIFLLLKQVSSEISRLNIRSDFLSAVSHDLRTPLASIQLHSDLLISGGEISTQERLTCYQAIGRGAGRLNDLISNLLSFSRIERSKEEYRLSEGNIYSVVEASARVCGDWLSQHEFLLETELERNLPLVIFDPEKVSQAVANLIDNAGKYSGSSKSIAVRLNAEADNVVVEVQDHGIGIPADEQEKVFQQFYRARNAKTCEGSGLGLFLVSETMRKHGGTVKIISRVGEGTTVRLIFPACNLVIGSEMNPIYEKTSPR